MRRRQKPCVGRSHDIDRKLDAIDKRLAAEFADYASLANPKPLTIAAVQGLLKADEALVLFLDVPRLAEAARGDAGVGGDQRQRRAGSAFRSARRRSPSA